MKPSPTSALRIRTFGSRGYTLVELMIAIAIGLFLVGGLLTLVQSMKRASLNQSGLSQLQDNERMSMQLITDVIKSTGYYTNPLVNTAASSFPIVAYPNANYTYAGQALVGTGSYLLGGNTITTRYLTTGTDNIINCTGNTSSVGAATFVNTFSIDASGNLVCTLIVNGAASPPVALIGGLSNLQIYYGVITNSAAATNSIDTYMDAASVTAAGYWANVKSVMVTLWFVNPLYGQPGQTNANQPQTIPFTRIIAVMDKTGVTT